MFSFKIGYPSFNRFIYFVLDFFLKLNERRYNIRPCILICYGLYIVFTYEPTSTKVWEMGQKSRKIYKSTTFCNHKNKFLIFNYFISKNIKLFIFATIFSA